MIASQAHGPHHRRKAESMDVRQEERQSEPARGAGRAGLFRAYWIHQATWAPFNGLYWMFYGRRGAPPPCPASPASPASLACLPASLPACAPAACACACLRLGNPRARPSSIKTTTTATELRLGLFPDLTRAHGRANRSPNATNSLVFRTRLLQSEHSEILT